MLATWGNCSGMSGPSLDLNFINQGLAGALDSRITFSRASTGTYVNSSGLIATAAIDAPRFDYNPSTLTPNGLLIEQQSTNLALYSEQFDTYWSQVAVTVSANATTSPDGTANADKSVETTATNVHSLQQTVSVTNAVTYTVSVYAKAAERTSFFILAPWSVAGNGAHFDLVNGVASNFGASVTATITNVGNGWYRCTAKATSAATTTTTFAFRLTESYQGNTSYTGNGTSGMYFWGAQFEASAFSTSYIPTVASQVTRSADIATMTGTNFSNWFSDGQGTFVCSVIANNYATTGVQTRTFWQLYDGSLNVLRVGRGSTVAVRFLESTAGVNQNSTPASAFASGTIVVGQTDNVAVGYSSTVPTIALNGTKFTTSSAAYSHGSGYNQLAIGSDGTTSTLYALNGTIKRLTFYPKRLTDTQIQSLSK